MKTTAAQRRILYGLAHHAGIFRLCRWLNRQGLNILTYHSVIDVPPRHYEAARLLYRNAIAADIFRAQLDELRQQFQILHPHDLPALLDGAAIPPRSLLITFDDGLLNNATVAWPLLRAAGLSAIFFLPTAFVDAASEGQPKLHWIEALIAQLSRLAAAPADFAAFVQHHFPPRPDAEPQAQIMALIEQLKAMPAAEREAQLAAMQADLDLSFDPAQFPADRDGQSILATMTWGHARQMQDEGAVFGTHTVNHHIISRVPPDCAEDELHDSAARLQKQLGPAPLYFAFPNGTAQDFEPRHVRMLADANYQAAFTQIAGLNQQPMNTLSLHRNNVPGMADFNSFRYRVAGCRYALRRSGEAGR